MPILILSQDRCKLLQHDKQMIFARRMFSFGVIAGQSLSTKKWMLLTKDIISVHMLPFEGYCQRDYHLRLIF